MDVVVVKTESGLEGLGEASKRAYGRFRELVRNLEVGETLRVSWKEPRSPGFHKLFFVMLGHLFDQQENFPDENSLRSWLTVGAGFAEFVPGPTGKMVALPKSISWERMDEGEFRDLVSAVWSFLRTDHAQLFLWPATPADVRRRSVETLLAGFEN